MSIIKNVHLISVQSWTYLQKKKPNQSVSTELSHNTIYQLITLQLTLKMLSAQVVETSGTTSSPQFLELSSTGRSHYYIPKAKRRVSLWK